MVHRMLLVKVGNNYVHLLKMFGVIFGFACVFFIFSSAYELNKALEIGALGYTAGASMGDLFGSITAPLGSLLFWMAFMVISIALYRSDRTIFPLEEDIEDLPEPSARRAKRR